MELPQELSENDLKSCKRHLQYIADKHVKLALVLRSNHLFSL